MQLVDALLQIPGSDEYRTRSSWLGVDRAQPRVRDEHNAQTDLQLIVNALLAMDPSGDRLRNFIENARQGVEGTDLGNTLRRLKEQVVEPNTRGTVLREKEHVFNLDLIAQEFSWMKSYSEMKQGLLGFAIPSVSYALLAIFRDRLQYSLRRERVWAFSSILELNPIHTPVEVAIREIARQIPRLQKKDMLIAVWAANHAPLVGSFWSQLSAKFVGPLPKRLIIILAVDSAGDIPPGLIRIEPPQFFQENEVFAWVRDIVYSKNWPPDTSVTWMNAIRQECSQGPQLVAEQVYLYLQNSLEYLEPGVTVEDFCKFLGAQ